MKEKISILLFVAVFASFVSFSLVFAAMTSSNYGINADSVNFGGGFGTSSNYIVEDTFGEISSGISTSSSYVLKAGYQQMLISNVALSISSSSVVMSPTIGGISGGTSNGTTTISIETDSASGYSLSIKASTDPALATSTFNFSDYTEASAGTPDYSWSVSSNTSEFGFSPEGTDILSKYKDNGSNCNTGSGDTSFACWLGFTTTDEEVSQSTSPNTPTPTETILRYRAESGTSNVQAPGDYSATITITAISN